MGRWRHRLSLLLLVVPVVLAGFSLATPQHAAAASATAAPACATHGFFGLEPWYRYIEPEFHSTSPAFKDINKTTTVYDSCDIKCFNFFTRDKKDPNECGQTHSDIPYVLLAIVDDLLRISGIVAIGFVMYGAFQFVGSQGNPESAANAQKTIRNALVGLALASVAVGFVSFLGSKLG